MPNVETKTESPKNKKMSTRVSVFESSLHKSQAWITEMHAELSWLSGDSVYQLLRAVLHTLRDQLSTDEAAHFAAELPMLLRGTFYESWNPTKARGKGATKAEFIQAVRDHMGNMGEPKYELETGIIVALSTVMNHVSSGEMDDIAQSAKKSLKSFYETIGNFNLGRTYQ
jgi:uncharacterized protein (DUF2267 family)